MNLLIGSSHPGCNGAIMYARRLAPLLQARGHKVWVAAQPGSWIARQLAGEVPVLETTFSRWPLGEVDRVGRFCRENGVEVYHSHLTRASNFGLLLRLRHGIPSLAHLHTNRPQLHAWFHRRVLAVSGETLARWRRRGVGLGSRGASLPNFVDLARFAPASGRPDRLRPALGVPASAPVALVLGTLSHRKGQDQAVAAWPAVRAAHPGATLALVGPGAAGAGLRGEGVVPLGMRDDIPELLPHADLVLIPSRDECFPMAALEAMGCGVPVVAFGVGGLPEALADGAGEVLRPGDVGALARACVRLLADGAARRSLGAAGLARARDLYAPESHLRALERHYAEVARPA